MAAVGLPKGVRQRLDSQLEAIPALLGDLAPVALTRRPPSGKWSAHENLAHLARYQQMFLARMQRILTEDRPVLPRYRAEEDPDFPAWVELPTAEVLRRLREGRRRLLRELKALADVDLAREGVHPAFGSLALTQWLEFFLAHEGHHLYVAMLRAREGGA